VYNLVNFNVVPRKGFWEGAKYELQLELAAGAMSTPSMQQKEEVTGLGQGTTLFFSGNNNNASS
jgi:hypothetical protein